MVDLVLKLREIRRMRGMSQKDVARRSGIGEKTISSFETGERIGSLKLAQLERILAAYGITPAEFFSGTLEQEIAAWALDDDAVAATRLLDELQALPKPIQRNLLANFHLMVEAIAEARGEQVRGGSAPKAPFEHGAPSMR
jgi:transcriptional regulator with XRE-family HTH domain